MATASVDCRFYLLGSCRNGDACPFRHSEEARGAQEECAEFAQTGKCSAPGCSKRHGEAPRRATKPPSEVPCRNEENGGECTRPDCIFKHTRASAKKPGGGLNAGAKAFVPKTRAAAGMEWTAEPTAAPAATPVRPRTFGNMEWTPKAATEPAMRPAVWPAAQAAGPATFGNKEWTPKVTTEPAIRPTARPAAWPAAQPAGQGTFGNMEWTPKSAAEPAVRPAMQPAAQTAGRGAFGSMEWTAGPATSAAAAGRPQRPPTGWPSVPPAQQASAFAPKPASGLRWPSAPAPAQSVERPPAVAPAPPRVSKPGAAGSVQTIFDILGIAEEKPAEAAEKHSQQSHRSRVRARQESSAGSSPATNSPASGACYASQFPAYVVGDTSATPAVEPAVEPAAEAKPASLPAPAMAPARPLTPPPPAAQPASGAASPPSATTAPPSTDAALPKVLSFQEIMARKRRKQAAEAEAKAAAAAAAAVAQDTEPRTPAKRQNASQEPGGKRGRAAAPPTPATKNYIAQFERELGDLSTGLSGPLENSPSSDRISRATLGDTYIDADIGHLLDS